MIKLVLYQSFNQIRNYVEVEELIDYPVLTPSPDLADTFLDKIQLPAQTLPAYLDRLKNQVQPDSKVLKKSDALWHLGILWKELYPDRSIGSFLYHYHLLTELRSLSLDQDVLEEVFQFYPEEKHFLIESNKLITKSNLLDEFKLNQLLKETKDEKILFWGFSQMNGIQVDAINNLSLENKTIYIFIPRSFQSQWKKTDWTQWLKSELVDLGEEENFNKFFWSEFPRYRLNSSLKTLTKSIEKEPEVQFLKKGDFTSFLELSQRDQFFQFPVSIFDERLNEIKNIFQKVEFDKKELEQWIYKEIKKYKKNYLYLRILFEMRDKLKDFGNQINFSKFHQDLMLLYLQFSLPRVKASNFRKNKLAEGSNVYCLTRQLGYLSSGTWRKSVALENFIINLSPIPNPKLDLLFKISDVTSAYSNNTYLLTEQGMREEDSDLNDFLNKIKAEEFVLEKDQLINDRLIEDYTFENNNQKMFSATKIQSFIDCPRKFAHLYIEKEASDIEYLEEIDAREMGDLEHRFIKHYCEKYDSFSPIHFKEEIDDFYFSYKNKNKKQLIAEKELGRYLELSDFSKNGILFFYDLKEKFPEVSWKFEKSLTDPSLSRRGSIDLYGTSTSGRVFILDFKRGVGSIPRPSQVTSFKKIQLHFYLNSISKYNQMTIGYICLEDLSQSWVYDSEFDVEAFDFKCPTKRTQNQWMESIANYPAFEQKIMDQINNTNDFKPGPIEPSVCKFCNLRAVCSKGDLLWS